MLHTKYSLSFDFVVSEKKIFSCISHYKAMADNDAHETGPVWTPGARLAGFIKRTTIHCYIQNLKSMGAICCHGN